MAGFSYFFLNVTKGDLENAAKRSALLEKAGLASVLGDIQKFPEEASLCETHSPTGPWKTSGVMLAVVSKHNGAPEITSPDWDRQEWRPIGEGTVAWIGWEKENPPTPYDLERNKTVGGYDLPDDLTNVWTIPIARSPDPNYPFGVLEKSYRFDASGIPVGSVVKQQEWLWELSGEIRDWYAFIEDRQPKSWLVLQALRVMQFNYRLGMAEVNCLAEMGANLLTDVSVNSITRGVFGYEIVEQAKKKPADHPSTPAAS